MGNPAQPKNPDGDKVDRERFDRCARVYVETSAFNFLVENVGLSNLELTRAYQRRKGVIFVTSPTMLWEIMLNSDRQRADMLLMAAQALFDPVLLGTPTELAIRYLRSAYPNNVVNYDVTSDLSMSGLWSRMTRDFGCTMNYDFDQLVRQSAPIRAISRNLRSVLEDAPHDTEIVDLARVFVVTVFDAAREDIEGFGLDATTAKLVILYTFLFLLAHADLDGSAARKFWLEKGYVGPLERAEVTKVFLDYPEIFVRGPILEMAVMAAHQYRTGKTNRGAIHDGMHMVYAPYVSAILSNDRAFLTHAAEHQRYHTRLLHMSQVQISGVELDLNDYPDDQTLHRLDKAR